MLQKKIVVVGAGTSGWIAASAIKKNLPDLDVTIVYDSKIPTIGVGEGVTFGMPHFMRNILGISDEQWMDCVRATYKVAILHQDWTDQEHYFSGHCFDFPAQCLFKSSLEHLPPLAHAAQGGSVDQYSANGGIVDLWYTLYQQGKLGKITKQDLSLSLSENAWFAKNNRSIRTVAGDWLTSPSYGHTYHYNAELLGNTIGDMVGKPAGVNVIDSHITSVETINGSIRQLHLENGQTVAGDLFIDCTGFKRLLVSELDYRWIDADEFANDSAMVCQIKYDDTGHPLHKISEVSTWAAMKQGWRFSIPLQHRSGNGYIFNSRTVTNETDLTDELVSKLGINTRDFRLIRWTPGHYEYPARANCIALGLAQGFTDPWDANNLNLTCRLIMTMVEHINTDTDSWITDLQNVLNYRSQNWWTDIDMRVQSCLRLSPRRDTEHYRMMADHAEKTKLRERFIEHVTNSRTRDYSHGHRMLWPSFVHVLTALRYDIPLPYTEYDSNLETLAKHYFDFCKTKYQILSQRAPGYSEYYQNQTP
jgi:tryptophan halogenase